MPELRAPLRDWESDDDWLSWLKPSPFLISWCRKVSFKVLVEFLQINLSILPAVIGFTPTPHLSPPNIDEPHKLSLIVMFVMFAPNGGKPWDGKSDPWKLAKWILWYLINKNYLTWSSENIWSLLSLFPLSSAILKPNLKKKKRVLNILATTLKSFDLLTFFSGVWIIKDAILDIFSTFAY